MSYVDTFGLQWNKFRETQLDSFTGTTISRDRLLRQLGGSFDVIKGKRVLEVGCGAGRFTEVLLQEGAHVYAVDLSSAVEANYLNCNKYPNYNVARADVTRLPFKPETFDVVICIGVIQHTPTPELTIKKLCEQVCMGGRLIIDHYSHNYPSTPTRRLLRALIKDLPPEDSFHITDLLADILWPYHRKLNKKKHTWMGKKVRVVFKYLSPVVDYYDEFPQLNDYFLGQWAKLDTYDTLTDTYKHKRSADDIWAELVRNKMDVMCCGHVTDGVEAMARKPRYPNTHKPLSLFILVSLHPHNLYMVRRRI